MVIILGFQTSNTYTCNQRFSPGQRPLLKGKCHVFFRVNGTTIVQEKQTGRNTGSIRIISNPVAWVFPGSTGGTMIPDNTEVQSHYAALLARNYIWMAGGIESNIAKNTRFFKDHAISPSGTGIAIDLGAGCGFQSIPLASAGFAVVAVDFSREMLEILKQHAGTLPVRTVTADILTFTSWTGLHPELIICMGDTLTHLPDMQAVRDLIRQCFQELVPEGKLVLSFRNYSREPDGSTVIIPVRRDPGRIFVCRLDFGREAVRVTDILYSEEFGIWVRAAGSYPKLRSDPEVLISLMTGEGLDIRELFAESGMITIIAQKPAGRC
jgi:SAM-dependent methyltransferase